MPRRPLHVLLVGEDSALRDKLVEALEREQSIGTVRTVSHDSWVLTGIPEPDVVLFDAGPPLPAVEDVEALNMGRKEPLAFVLASDVTAETRELARAVRAVAFLRKDSGVASIAPVVVALAAFSSPEVPL
jgi:DNA-binding NarL/FixJ family response regulator